MSQSIDDLLNDLFSGDLQQTPNPTPNPTPNQFPNYVVRDGPPPKAKRFRSASNPDKVKINTRSVKEPSEYQSQAPFTPASLLTEHDITQAPLEDCVAPLNADEDFAHFLSSPNLLPISSNLEMSMIDELPLPHSKKNPQIPEILADEFVVYKKLPDIAKRPNFAYPECVKSPIHHCFPDDNRHVMHPERGMTLA